MQKRITVSMMKAKTPNEKKLNEMFDSWLDNLFETLTPDKFADFIVQTIGAAMLDNINLETRMNIFVNAVDDVALTLFTPKALKEFKKKLKEGFNEECKLYREKIYIKDENGKFLNKEKCKIVSK